MVNKTIWLLGNIEDGTYSDPNVVSNPPERGWAGDWEDLFDGESLEELRERFNIKRPNATSDSQSTAQSQASQETLVAPENDQDDTDLSDEEA